MKAFLAVLVAGLVSTAVWADVESGPKAGQKVPVLKAFGVVGSVTEKETDYAKDRGEAPTVYVFVQAEHFGRPTARFLKTLDEKIGELDDAAKVVVVWLGSETEKNKEYLPRVQKSMKFGKSDLAVYTGDKSGPDNWGINPDAHVTVAAAHKGKVVKSFAYTSLNETDVKGIEEAMKKELKK